MLDLINPGARLFVGSATNEPAGVLSELTAMSLPSELTFVQFPIGGLNRFDFTSFGPNSRAEVFFMTPDLARAKYPEHVKFMPMQMRWVFDYLSQDLDVALIQVAYDAQGTLRLGPNVDFLPAVLSHVPVVIAELNRAIQAPAGCPQISPERIDCLIETNRPVATMVPPKIDEAAAEIGRLVGDLVRDGDCLQTGIGAIPAAILTQLEDKHDLGMHGGLIDDAGMRLIQRGNINGARKGVDTHRHITGIGMGSQDMLDWLAETPSVVFRGADYTHELRVIAQIENFVSVNSALQVDLFGQINAEFAGGRQISGTGGSVDFMRAAKASSGGRSIVAMQATARGGTLSRIVPQVDMVTALRTDVDMVVTEYGIADLRHTDSRGRVDALIEIAAPQFRDELRNP